MSTHPRQVYVDPAGDDVSGQGTQRRPFASIDRAARFLRTRDWSVNQDAEQFINVAPGRYFNSNATLTTMNSGGNGFNVTFRNTGTLGSARLIAGRLASGWTLHSGSIYKLTLSSPCWALYENGVRARVARFPALDPEVGFPCSKTPYLLADHDATPSYTALTYRNGDFDPSSWDLSSTRLVSWGSLFGSERDWFLDTAQPTALDTGTRTYTLGSGGTKFPANPDSRYYVQGPLELLTGAGQFTIRLEASVWTLYYWPRNTPIEDQEIIIPTSKSAVSITGTSPVVPAHHIKFQGFSVEGTDFDSWYQNGNNGNDVEYDYFNTRSQFRHGGFRLENCENVTIYRNHIHNVGLAGIFMQGACVNNTIWQNWIEHTGVDGISVNGMPPGAGLLSHDNLFDDQRINDVGELDGGGNCVRISQSANNVVRYHHFYNSPRRALWFHGDYAVPASDNYCRNNYGHHLLVENVNQDTGDDGALTMSFLSSPAGGGGSQVPVNILDQVIIDGSRANSTMIDYAPAAVFGDNDSSGQQISNIKASNIQWPATIRFNSSDLWSIQNVSWVGGFDEGLMDTANIGVTADFPY